MQIASEGLRGPQRASEGLRAVRGPQGASKDFREAQEAKEETLKWPKEDLEEAIKGFRGQNGRTDGQMKINICFL